MEELLETSVCFLRDRLEFAGLKEEEAAALIPFQCRTVLDILVIDA